MTAPRCRSVWGHFKFVDQIHVGEFANCCLSGSQGHGITARLHKSSELNEHSTRMFGLIAPTRAIAVQISLKNDKSTTEIRTSVQIFSPPIKEACAAAIFEAMVVSTLA